VLSAFSAFDQAFSTCTKSSSTGVARPKMLTATLSFDFSGFVDEVRPEKEKGRVMVQVFGRATPVELDFMQVEKA